LLTQYCAIGLCLADRWGRRPCENEKNRKGYTGRNSSRRIRNTYACIRNNQTCSPLRFWRNCLTIFSIKYTI
jgi:hypothetical protein